MKAKDGYVTEYLITEKTDLNSLELKALQNFKVDNLKFSYIDDIIDFLNKNYYLNVSDVEHGFLIAQDFENKILGIIETNKGSSKSIAINKMNIAAFLVLIGARRFIYIHNHPDNISKPSNNDVEMEAVFNEIARLFDIEYIGGYVIYEDGFDKIIDAFVQSVIKSEEG